MRLSSTCCSVSRSRSSFSAALSASLNSFVLPIYKELYNMHNSLSRATQNKSADLHAGWERAIVQTKAKIARLQAAVRVFEERKAAGEPWPGTQSPNQIEASATRS